MDKPTFVRDGECVCLVTGECSTGFRVGKVYNFEIMQYPDKLPHYKVYRNDDKYVTLTERGFQVYFEEVV